MSSQSQVVFSASMSNTGPVIFTPAPPVQWEDGETYLLGDAVTHESVTYVAIAPHTATQATRPDVASDFAWQAVWEQTGLSWSDFMFDRLPSWVREIDNLKGSPLQRFLRILGRAMNQTQQESDDFPFLKDPQLAPSAYLEAFGNMLGVILPTPLEESFRRRLLGTIVQFYRQKGTSESLEFIVSRYLGVEITIFDEDLPNRSYAVDFDQSQVPVPEQQTFAEELDRILALYEPAGLIATTALEDEDDQLNIKGSVGPADASESFTINPLPGSPTS